LFGRVLVVGGNPVMLGAPVLAGTAALRMGAGLVQIAMPGAVLPAALSVTPELIGISTTGAKAEAELDKAAERADALVIGPGLSTSPAARRLVLRLIQLAKPVVIDADALNILSAQKSWPKNFRGLAVLTPHPGEMARLNKLLGREVVPSDEPGRIELAHYAAVEFGQVVLLKGHRTIIADADRYRINTTGNSALSKAGSGDVLSGIIGTLLAQKMPPFDAAALGAHIHGRAGELASQIFGLRSPIARDVIDKIHAAIAELEASDPGA
jgi:NAD(P)H-hydrate epimerase